MKFDEFKTTMKNIFHSNISNEKLLEMYKVYDKKPNMRSILVTFYEEVPYEDRSIKEINEATGFDHMNLGEMSRFRKLYRQDHRYKISSPEHLLSLCYYSNLFVADVNEQLEV